MRRERPWAALLAATLLSLPLGSIYAFSVLLRPIELDLHIPRSVLSLVFGLAAIGFTAGSVIAPLLYRLVPAPVLVFGYAAIAASGIALAAMADEMAALLFGYGVVFGTGGGAAYISLQQGVNLLVQGRRGLVNGYLVSLYPMGAMIAAPAFHWGNEHFGWRATLSALALALLVSGVAAAGLTWFARTRIAPPVVRGETVAPAPLGETFWRLAAVFFLAAAAGLTVLSQAKEIVMAYGGSPGLAIAATTVITGLIAAARIVGGWLVDRLPVPYVSSSAHLLALTGAVLLTLWPAPGMAAVAIGMIGIGYGFVSGATAGGIAVYWRASQYGWVAGRIYVAWCAAAISLPVLAGYLFDVTQGYVAAVIIAGCGNLAGIFVALRMKRRA